MQPFWDVQDEDLYVKKAHYLWRPTEHDMVSIGRNGRESLVNSLTWHPVLPPGQELKRTQLPNGRKLLELNLHDIPAFSSEEYMPPVLSSMYHVDFYYSPYRTPQESFGVRKESIGPQTQTSSSATAITSAKQRRNTLLAPQRTKTNCASCMPWHNRSTTRITRAGTMRQRTRTRDSSRSSRLRTC